MIVLYKYTLFADRIRQLCAMVKLVWLDRVYNQQTLADVNVYTCIAFRLLLVGSNFNLNGCKKLYYIMYSSHRILFYGGFLYSIYI